MIKKMPWPRIAIEGLVIVASILLAFALDAWWDRRQLRDEAHDLHVALLAEFQEAAVEVERAVDWNRGVVAAADTVLDQLGNPPGASQVSAGSVGALIRTPTTDPQDGNLTALLSSGDFGLVRGGALREAIADWPAALRDLQEEEIAAKTFVHEELVPFLAAAIDLDAAVAAHLAFVGLTSHRGGSASPTGTLPADVVRLPQDPELRNLVLYRRYLSVLVVDNAAPIQAHLDHLIAQLEAVVQG